MSLQHHFIVVIENGKAFIDHEVSINYDEGKIYDTELDRWVDPYDQYEQYEQANELLQDVLMKGIQE